MVRGLDIFREWFAAYADQYVLIGGTAASLTMEEAGLAFRATTLGSRLPQTARTAMPARVWRTVRSARLWMRATGWASNSPSSSGAASSSRSLSRPASRC